MAVARACRALGGAAVQGGIALPGKQDGDVEVVEKLNEVVTRHGRWGFWKCYHWMRQRGAGWNDKRVLRLNLPRRSKRRLPARVRQPLDAPQQINQIWSLDFMHDTLWCEKQFRTLNILDEGVREVLAIEVDISLSTERVIRMLDQFK